MRIAKTRLVQMIREEVTSVLAELTEAADVTDAEADKKSKEKTGDEDRQADTPSDHKQPPAQPVKRGGEEPPTLDEPEGGAKGDLPAEDEPADDEIEQDVDEPEEPADDAGGEKLSKELVGKSIQSITQNPKSKILPGAVDIEVQFEQSAEPLHILVQKSGKIVYFYGGQMHNSL